MPAPKPIKHIIMRVYYTLYYTIIIFYMKITILLSIFFQNIHQNASIVTCLQNFLHE